ncbi:MAG: zinc dependent phospholipase C family protein [Armatimonadota bacterium]
MRTHCLVIGLLMTITALAAQAGQIPGHIYTAMQSRAGLTGPAKTAVDNNLAYYLTGAQGPDTIGIIQYELKKISFFTSVGEETHYSPLKALLAFNILLKASNDKERAYALGWLTHYVNDTNIHPVVNNWGGFYGKNPKHHKELEQLETKHVFMKHSDVVTKELATTIPTVFGKDFAGFIFDAYGETYPNEPKYQNGNDWGVYPNREYFMDQEDKAADWCLSAEKTFYNSHIDGTGKHGYWPSTVPIPNEPSNDAYAKLMKAIEIVGIDTYADRIAVTVRVNDSKLYGRFTADWEKAAAQSIEQGKTLLTAASAYVANPTPDTRAALLRLIPNANLDQPIANYDDAAVFPGNTTVDRIRYRLTVTPQAAAGKPAKAPIVLEGAYSPIIYGTEDLYGSLSGTAIMNIPLGAAVAPYKFNLAVGLSGTKLETRPEYKDVDWTDAKGSHPNTWMSSAGTVALGAPFKVSMSIPPALRGKGIRRWAVTSPGYELTTSDLNALDMKTWSQDVRPDVVILDESISDTILTTTLQITRMDSGSQQQIGDSQLVLIWSEHGKPGDLRGMDAVGQAQEEYAAALSRLAGNPNLAKLEDQITKYVAELDKKGLSLDEKKKLAEKKSIELIPQLGLTKAYADVDNAQKELNALEGIPFHVITSINVRPTSLSFPVAAGWTEKTTDPPPAFRTKQRVEKMASQKNENGKLKWSVSAGLELEWDRWSPEAEARLKSSHSDCVESALTIGEFTGSIYTQTKETSPRDRSVMVYGLLHKGQAGLSVFSYNQGYGAEIFDQGTKIYDGAEDLSLNMRTTHEEMQNMIQGLTTAQVP